GHPVVALNVGGQEHLAVEDERHLRSEKVARVVRPVDRDGILSVVQLQRLCHRSSAIATSSSRPVPSSSCRGDWNRSRRTERISPRGRPLTKMTKRKPNFSS